jgi:hypothetical protein
MKKIYEQAAYLAREAEHIEDLCFSFNQEQEGKIELTTLQATMGTMAKEYATLHTMIGKIMRHEVL